MAPREHFFRRYTTTTRTTKLEMDGGWGTRNFRVSGTFTPLKNWVEGKFWTVFFLILFVIFDMIFFYSGSLKNQQISQKNEKKNPYFILFWPHILADTGQYPKNLIFGTCSSINYYQIRLREFDTLAGFHPSLFATFFKNILFTYWNFS